MNLILQNRNIQFGLFALAFLMAASAAVFSDQYWIALVPFALLLVYASWQSIDTAFYLLIASLPFSIEFQVNSTLGTDLPDELLMILVSLLFFFYMIFKPTSISSSLKSHPLLWLVVAGMLWALVCSIFSTQPLLSAKYVLAKCWYLGAFLIAGLVVFNRKDRIKKSIYIFSVSLLLVMGISLVRHAFNDFTFAGINDAVSPFFRNHVNYSAMLVCIVPILIVYRQQVKGIAMRRSILLVLLIVFAALFFSYARGAWLALLVGCISGWLLKRKLLVAALISAVLLITVVISWLSTGDCYLRYAHDYRSTIFHENFSDHLVATYRFKDVSTAERFNRWIAGIRMVKDRPIAGFGPSTFYSSYKSYTIPAFRTWVSDNPERSTVHNYFLLMLVEQGIPGLLLFILLSAALLYYAQKIYHKANDIFYKGIALGVGMIFPMILTVNSLSDLIETDKIGSIYFLCIAILIIADINTKDDKHEEATV